SGATTGLLKCPNGMRLRFARWEATRGPRRGTVCMFHGRGEFIEKYFEVVADLRRRGFAVATMDWRGQGGSARELRNPSKGYVRNGRDRPLELDPFEGNPITSDPERYNRNRLVLEAAPALGLGSPTIAWLRAALRSIAKLTAPDYPLKVEVPLLLFAAGKDTI